MANANAKIRPDNEEQNNLDARLRALRASRMPTTESNRALDEKIHTGAIPQHMLKWAEDNSAVCEGRTGKLLSKLKDGTIGVEHPETFKRALEILKDPNKREKKEYKQLLDYLLKGRSADFGRNFETIADAVESKDKDISEFAKKYVRNADQQGFDKSKAKMAEKRFLKELKELKLRKIDSGTLVSQTRGILSVAGIGETGESPHEEHAVEVTNRTDLGLLPEPPEEKVGEYRNLSLKFTGFLKKSTAHLNEVRDLVRKSEELAAAKETLYSRLKTDPGFVKEYLAKLIADYELLKKSALVMDETEKNPEVLEALKKFDEQRKAYFEMNAGVILNKDETPHQKFLQAKESGSARALLEQAAQKNIENLLKTSLELDFEREVDGVIFEAENGGKEVDEKDFVRTVGDLRTKYDLKPEVAGDIPFLKGLKEKANAYLSHAREHTGTKSEYLKTTPKFRRWENSCVNVKEHIGLVERTVGIQLVEKRNGLGVYPRRVELVYEEPEVKTWSKRAEVDELDPNLKDKTHEFTKDEKGKTKLFERTATLVDIRYAPSVVDEDDQRELDAFDEHHPVKTFNRGRLQFVLEVDGKTEIKPEKEFLEWVAACDVRERIRKPEDLERQVADTLGTEVKIKAGARFLDQSVLFREDEKGPKSGPKYRIIEVASVQGDRVTLTSPVILRPKSAVHTSNPIKIDTVGQDLSLGEFYSLIARRNLVSLDAAKAEKYVEGLSTEFEEYTSTDDSGERETLEIARDGTMGDVLSSHGDTIFEGENLTPEQRAAFIAYPAFRVRGRDSGGHHFIRTGIPAVDFRNQMHLAGKGDAGAGVADAGTASAAPHSAEGAAAAHTRDEHKEAHEEHGDHGGDHGGHGGGEHGEVYGLKPPEEGNPGERNDVIPLACTGIEAHTHITEKGFLRSLWQNTRILASDDMFGLGKSVYEHYQRRWHRRSKEKFSQVGKGLPLGYGEEFRRIKQQAENEEVHQNAEALEHLGIDAIHKILHNAGNTDQIKACFEVLAKKGHIRWDDIHMWQALNHYLPEGLMVPIPENHNPYAKDKQTKKTGFEYLQSAIDYLWGESTYVEWFEQNNSTYGHKLKEFFEQGKQLEGDTKATKSVDGELQHLLEKHKKGEYVDPHQYEGLLHFIIEAGKGSGPETKLYYIVEGVAAENPNTHETILSMERLGSINGDYLNRFPMMDYLTRRDVPRPDGTTSPWTLADFKAWCKYWDDGAPADPKEHSKPNARVSEHLWNYVLTDEKTIIRNNKGLRKAEEMDHDDAHIIIPLADEETVQNACMSASGSKRYFTQEGYANAYVGYGQYAKTLAQRNDKSKLMSTLTSFTRFNSIMDGRYHKENTRDFARLGATKWNRGCVVDDWAVGNHKKQMEDTITSIAYAYGDEELIHVVETMHQHTYSLEDPAEAAKQKEIQKCLDNFSNVFKRVVDKDKGKLMAEVVSGAKLRGVAFGMSTAEKKARFKAAEGAEDELSETFIH